MAEKISGKRTEDDGVLADIMRSRIRSCFSRETALSGKRLREGALFKAVKPDETGTSAMGRRMAENENDKKEKRG